MKKAIIGKKVGMTQIFDEQGKVVPVTVIEAGPCIVSQKKTVEVDGYNAIQVGFGDLRPKQVNKPMKGHFDKANVAPKRTLREFRLEDTNAYNVGDLIKADVFAAGDKIDVVGTRACSDPSRVFKGKKMAGHLGAERVTVQNLTVVKVDVENNLIAIKGAVPGPKGGIVLVCNSVKA